MLGSSLAPGSYEDVQTLTLWHSISPDLSGVRSSSARRPNPFTGVFPSFVSNRRLTMIASESNVVGISIHDTSSNSTSRHGSPSAGKDLNRSCE